MTEEYIYPSDIRDDAYKNRKITIKIKQKTLTATAVDGYNRAIDVASSAASVVGGPSGTFDEMKINLDAHSKSKHDKTAAIIVLPLPNTFSDSQDHGWDRETGVMGTIGKSAMGSSIGGAVKKLTDGGKRGGVLGKLINSVIGDINVSLDIALGSASSQAGLRKPIFDPGYFQNYTGSAPRVFNVAWDLVPKSAAEALDIMMIIMKLKQYTSPTTISGGISLLAPHYLSIEFNNPFISTMIKLDQVVVTNLSIDYGADGAMQQTADGMPKHMTLTMTLSEVDMVTSDSYTTQPELVKPKSRTTLQTTTPTGG